jgi:DNA repair exonuclease SbcCD ATPase subunit
MLHNLPLDAPSLQLLLWIVSALFVIAMVRWFRLSGENRKMRRECPKMEKLVAEQQIELTAIQHDARSWRAKTHRQFDALRAELSALLQQAERGNQYAQKELETAQQKALEAAHAKIADLEARLAAKPSAIVPETVTLPKSAGPVKPPQPSLPSLPAMETLRLQALESELAAAKAEIAGHRQQNAALQRALLLARRRQPALRKASGRGTVRNA